jgi:hypothetical protein
MMSYCVSTKSQSSASALAACAVLGVLCQKKWLAYHYLQLRSHFRLFAALFLLEISSFEVLSFGFLALDSFLSCFAAAVSTLDST